MGPGHATKLNQGCNNIIKNGIQEVVVNDNIIKGNQEVTISDKDVHSSIVL